MRAVKSVAPPADPDTMRIGLLGHSCADTFMLNAVTVMKTVDAIGHAFNASLLYATLPYAIERSRLERSYYSSFIPAAFITLPRRAISSLMRAENSAGE